MYVMSRDQRLHDNHALLAAQAAANDQQLPLHIVFFLYDKTGLRAREHYQFMLDGLRVLAQDAQELNISFSLFAASEALDQLAKLNPTAVYFDYSPLRGSRLFKQNIASQLTCPVYEVDTHNVVPVWVASDKQEFAARTLRPKIHRLLPAYLQEPTKLMKHAYGSAKQHLDEAFKQKVIAGSVSNGQKLQWGSGEDAAQSALADFMQHRLGAYAEQRNDPSVNGLSELSPYLHFGQMSSLRVALNVIATGKHATSADVLLEEMIVRKELSDNFCHYNQAYDTLNGAPDWAKQTLQDHAQDAREFMYTKSQFTAAKTHDEAWNAAQRQLTRSGKMHGYMRMYWAKKVLEWTESPEQALDILIYLNDFYSIDGGDPNGYVGILWSIAGLHDRPWFERAVYGKVRYMNASGLRRKFAIDAYIEQWQS